jgi:pyruvate dehydrogenase E1 component alpha subunit
MSDPGTTYRTHEEVQRMRSTQDPTPGLQHASDTELKASSNCFGKAVEEAKSSTEP